MVPLAPGVALGLLDLVGDLFVLVTVLAVLVWGAGDARQSQEASRINGHRYMALTALHRLTQH